MNKYWGNGDACAPGHTNPANLPTQETGNLFYSGKEWDYFIVTMDWRVSQENFCFLNTVK